MNVVFLFLFVVFVVAVLLVFLFAHSVIKRVIEY